MANFPNYYMYNPNFQSQQNLQPNMQPNQQIQNGGFIPVPNEAFARNYPVAYGNSVTFKDESAPYIYTKTMGFSQLEQPVFEKYRLIKEDLEEKLEEPLANDYKSELDEIWKEIEQIKMVLKKEANDE